MPKKTQSSTAAATQAPKRVRKRRVYPYLSIGVHQRLLAHCARRGVSESAVIEAALVEHLDGTSDATLVLEHLNAIRRDIGTMRRDHNITAELTSEWMRVWYRNTPPLPEPERRAGASEAETRYRLLCEAVSKNIASGASLETFIRDVTAVRLSAIGEHDTELGEGRA